MMKFGIAGLVAAYLVIALLLLKINMHSRWGRPVKAGVTLAALAFYLVSYLSIPELLGWPTAQGAPARFRLHAVHVQQPDKVSKSKGTIYLWLTDVRDLAQHAAPRAFQFPYSASMHDIVISATAKLARGVPQMGVFKLPPNAHVSGLDTAAGAALAAAPVTFFDVPDPLFPDK